MKLIPYTIIIIHDYRLKKVCLLSNYRHQKLALNLLQSWHLECKLGTGCFIKPKKTFSEYALWVLKTCVSRCLIRCKRLEENLRKLPMIWMRQTLYIFWLFSQSGIIRLISSQSCKKVSMVPQAQFLVLMWFLKISGIFCQNALSNWSNSWYIFLLPKKKDLLSAKFCNCYLYLH